MPVERTFLKLGMKGCHSIGTYTIVRDEVHKLLLEWNFVYLLFFASHL